MTMPPPSPLVNLIRQQAAARGLDPAAVLAVASREGLGGGIGDGGHAFGPWQLNNAGGVITGKFKGQTPEQINQWAWSPAGISYALNGIAGVAKGLRGPQAVNAIVSRFERPANPGGEIAGALHAYGGPVNASAPAGRGIPTPTPAQAGNPTGSNLAALIASTNQNLGLDGSPMLEQLLASRLGQPQPGTSPVPAAAAPHAATGPGGLATVGGVQVDSKIVTPLEQIIRQFGVHPTSGYRDAAHNSAVGGAQNSDHLRGDAVDFGGNPQQLAALYRYAQGRFPYTEPMSQAKDHVHISFRRP